MLFPPNGWCAVVLRCFGARKGRRVSSARLLVPSMEARWKQTGGGATGAVGVLCAVVGVHVQMRRATSWQADRGADKLEAARRRDEEEAQRGRRGEGGMRRTGSGTMFRKKAVTRLSSAWWQARPGGYPRFGGCGPVLVPEMNFKNIPSGVGQQPDALWLTRTIHPRAHIWGSNGFKSTDLYVNWIMVFLVQRRCLQRL